MRAIGLTIAALATCLGVLVGVAGPDTTPVDPAPYLDGNGGDGGGGR